MSLLLPGEPGCSQCSPRVAGDAFGRRRDLPFLETQSRREWPPRHQGFQSQEKVNTIILTVGKNNFSEDILVTEALNPSVFLTERNLNWQSVFRTEGLRFPEACVAFSCFGSPSKPGGQGARLGEAFSISADRVRAGEELLGSVASCPVQPQCE